MIHLNIFFFLKKNPTGNLLCALKHGLGRRVSGQGFKLFRQGSGIQEILGSICHFEILEGDSRHMSVR